MTSDQATCASVGGATRSASAPPSQQLRVARDRLVPLGALADACATARAGQLTINTLTLAAWRCNDAVSRTVA